MAINMGIHWVPFMKTLKSITVDFYKCQKSVKSKLLFVWLSITRELTHKNPKKFVLHLKNKKLDEVKQDA